MAPVGYTFSEKLILNEKEASQALGISISRLKRLVETGVIPDAFVLGNTIRVRRARVVEMLNEDSLSSSIAKVSE